MRLELERGLSLHFVGWSEEVGGGDGSAGMVFVDGVLGGRADLPMSDDKVVEQTKGEKGIRSKAVLKDAMQYLSEERVLDGDIVAISFMKEEEDDGDMLIIFSS
ncbi:hypothetical protein GOBAR_DD31694 [Gossypium barbadense]|nr:hypothetical protein GOBAR_DD31694 [Gossypium barbadense]